MPQLHIPVLEYFLPTTVCQSQHPSVLFQTHNDNTDHRLHYIQTKAYNQTEMELQLHNPHRLLIALHSHHL